LAALRWPASLERLTQRLSPYHRQGSLILAVGVNILLLFCVYQLVTPGRVKLPELTNLNFVDFIRLKEPPLPPPEPPKKPPPEEPPPEEMPNMPKVMEFQPPEPAPPKLKIPSPAIPTTALQLPGDPALGEYKIGAAPAFDPNAFNLEIDENPTPTFRARPMYPQRALMANIEGNVVVEFTIKADGSVTGPLKIVKATPPGIFNDAVLRAITKWKFKPRIVQGKAVPRRARQIVVFSLAER
jgi:protein TonB